MGGTIKLLAFAILVLLAGLISSSFAIEALCTKCNITTMTVDIKGAAFPGKVNITVQLFLLQLSDLTDPARVATAVEEGKISLDEITKTATMTPVVGENITVVFNDTRSGFEQQLCRKATDSNGTIRCEAVISVSGCGSVIARYISSNPKDVPKTTSMPYCIGGEIPFGMAINSAQCMMLFIILGLLVAALYASGKSPFAALDITTPKRPGARGYWPGYMHLKHKMPPKGLGIGPATRAATNVLFPPLEKRLAKSLRGIGASKADIRTSGLVAVASVMLPNKVREVQTIRSTLADLRLIRESVKTRKEHSVIGKQISELEEKERRIKVFTNIYARVQAETFKALFKPAIGTLSIVEIQELMKIARAHPEHYIWLSPSIELRPEVLKKMGAWADAAKERAIVAVREGKDPTFALRDAMDEIATEERKRLIDSGIPDEINSRFKKAEAEKNELLSTWNLSERLGYVSYPAKDQERYDPNSSREEDLKKLIDVFAPLYGAQWQADLAKEGLSRTAKEGIDVTADALSVGKLADEIQSAIVDLERQLKQGYVKIEKDEKTATEILKSNKAEHAIEKVEQDKAKLTEQCARTIVVDGTEAAIKIAGLIEVLNLKHKKDLMQEGAA